MDLARSGRVWEDFFKPGNIEPYLQAQSDLKDTLISIDELKEWYRGNDQSKTDILRAFVSEYAHQSTSLEQNPLHVGDSVAISDELEKQLFDHIDCLLFVIHFRPVWGVSLNSYFRQIQPNAYLPVCSRSLCLYASLHRVARPEPYQQSSASSHLRYSLGYLLSTYSSLPRWKLQTW